MNNHQTIKLFMRSYHNYRSQRQTKEVAFGNAVTFLRGTTIDRNTVELVIDHLTDHSMLA